MRNLCVKLIFVLLVITASLFGQNLSIQGVARDNLGQSLPDGQYSFTFRLYLGESGGSSSWLELQTLEVLNGVFSTVLGDATSMEGLDFNNQYWLSLEIDGNGELNPRTKLILSPYAIMAGLSGVDNVVPQTGNVGFGTANPDFPLDFGEVGGVKMAMFPGTTSNTAGIFEGWDHNSLLMGTFSQNGYSHGFLSTGYGTGDRKFSIGTGNNASGSSALFKPLMTIKTNGSVGIGIENPLSLLHILAENASLRATLERTNTTHEAFLQFKTGGVAKALFGFDNDMDDLSIYSYDGAGRIITFDGVSGNVGIGDATPDAKLDVAGDLKINAWAGEDLTANGHVLMGAMTFQWGSFTSNIDEDQYVYFDIPFANACFSVYLNVRWSGAVHPLYVLSTSTTGFRTNRNNNVDGQFTVDWFAIGH